MSNIKTQELIEVTKKSMEYTEESAPKCRLCKFAREAEDQYCDRMWHWECHFSNLCSFTVLPEARCSCFTKAK